MKRLIALSLIICLMGLSAVGQRMKDIEECTYFQLPAEKLAYNKVEVFVTLDQSKQREGIGKALGKFGVGEKTTEKAKDAAKDITEVWDTWYLVPDYIKVEKPEGRLKCTVKYAPDKMARPMGEPTYNATKEAYHVPYQVDASMKVEDDMGNVVLEKKFGPLSGSVWSPEWVTAKDAEGMGTYEKVCVRGAMEQARRELFGPYGFGVMESNMKLGKLRKMKKSKKILDDVISVLENKKSFVLLPKEKEVIKHYVKLAEQEIDDAKNKRKWAAYHNLAVCYAWLENEEKAKEYLEKDYKESEKSIKKVLKGRSYNMGDTKVLMAYRAIEPFVTYYPKAANKYRQFLNVVNQPLTKFTSFYAHNEFLSQVFGINFHYQFFPYQGYKGEPRKAECSIEIEDGRKIEYDVKFDRDGRIKQLQAEEISDDKDAVKTRKLQPIYNKDGDFVVLSNPNTRMGAGTVGKKELRHIEAPLTNKTKGEVDNVLKGGLFGSSKASAQLQFNLEGFAYYDTEMSYSEVYPVFKKMMPEDMKYSRARTGTGAEFSSKLMFDENSNVTLNETEGSIGSTMPIGVFDGNAKRFETEKFERHYKVLEKDKNGYPTKVDMNLTMIGENQDYGHNFLKHLKSWGDKGTTFDSKEFKIVKNETWNCEYQFDEKGNWTSLKMGPYTLTREIKY
ncbi:MAG: hypothetical protein K9I68_04975 [Bacteroidales bacterium]|nr:hypothetical protein [Bacteroidales bacterium]MCF8337790.1 hypothetical protein [Bacteroidales bacterium]